VRSLKNAIFFASIKEGAKKKRLFFHVGHVGSKNGKKRKKTEFTYINVGKKYFLLNF